MNNKTKIRSMSKLNIKQTVVFLTTCLVFKVVATPVAKAQFDINKSQISNIEGKRLHPPATIVTRRSLYIKLQQQEDNLATKNLQIAQIYNSYSGSWSGNFQMDRGNFDCISRGQLQFTVDSQGTIRGLLLASGEEIQLNGVVKPDGNFVATGNEGTEARGQFSGSRFVGVYGNQTWGCSGRIAGGKF